MSKPGADLSSGISLGDACPSGIRHVDGAKLNLAPVWNVRTWPAMPREKAQAAPTARPKVPMRRRGADCPVVVKERGNARGAKGVGHRCRAWANWVKPGGARKFSRRRQPSCDGTSRMMREYQVRFCERLRAKFPGPTRQSPPTRSAPVSLQVRNGRKADLAGNLTNQNGCGIVPAVRRVCHCGLGR
jgi:hypothetical protein